MEPNLKVTHSKFLTLLVAFAVVILFSGCAATKQEVIARGQSQMQDPSKSLWVTVESVPSGATVYGEQGGQPGTNLGTTPLTLKYTRSYGRLFGHCPDETIVLNEQASSPLSLSKSFLAFKCIVVKPGYRSQYINQTIEDSGGRWGPGEHGRTKSLAGGVRKTFTAFLQPILPPSPQPTTAPMQQQQQQQQQQTVIIPNTGGASSNDCISECKKMFLRGELKGPIEECYKLLCE